MEPGVDFNSVPEGRGPEPNAGTLSWPPLHAWCGAGVDAHAMDVAGADGGPHRVSVQGGGRLLGLHHAACATAAATPPQALLQL